MNKQIKPKLSFWQIWNMSFGFLGIQFGFALQNGNVSRIFETLGAEIDDIAILWIAAPVTGLLIQPIIGYLSDNTWNRFGRRRPFFMIGAILASIAILIMPNSPVLWFAAGMLWIMDASINVTMEPFRAFVGDMLPDEQRTRGFAMQSFFIGIGAFVASWLPYVLTNWFDVANVAPAGEIPDSVKYSFYLGGGVFITAVMWTVFRTKEYSPEELASFAEQTEEQAIDRAAIKYDSFINQFNKGTLIWTSIGFITSYLIYYFKLEKELYILSGGIVVFGLVQMATALLIKGDKTQNGFVHIITDLYSLPKTMVQLAFVQFFSWFALFAMWIYATSAVTSHIYHTSDATSQTYNEAANWVSGMFGWYNLFAAGFAFLLPVIAKFTNRKITHMFALIAGGLGLISFYFITNPDHLIYSMIGVGVAWASILSMPYAILTGSLPANKMGVYMGIFNFFIVIPQILAASILGFMLKSLFNSESIYALILGGISMIIAGFITLFVTDRKGQSS